MQLIGIVIYLAVLLLIGLLAARQMKDLRDYYAGGKRFGFWAAAFSWRATGESAWLLIGLTGRGAAVGAQALWVVFGEVLGVAAAWLFLCGRFKRRTDRDDSRAWLPWIATNLCAVLVDALRKGDSTRRDRRRLLVRDFWLVGNLSDVLPNHDFVALLAKIDRFRGVIRHVGWFRQRSFLQVRRATTADGG